MAYGTNDMVKERLGIDASDSTHDAEITNGLAYGDGFIDMSMTPHGSIPSPIPQAIKDASADFAAFYYLRNRNPEKATHFLDSGIRLVETYILVNYKQSVFIRSSEA